MSLLAYCVVDQILGSSKYFSPASVDAAVQYMKDLIQCIKSDESVSGHWQEVEMITIFHGLSRDQCPVHLTAYDVVPIEKVTPMSTKTKWPE